MFPKSAIAAASLYLLAQAPAVSAALENSTECVDVHFIIARGSTESYPGTPYPVFEAVAANMTVTTNYESIIYPATNETSTDSYFVGVAAVGAQVNAYAEACPDAKLVLGSYSQGCLIIGDALAGGGGVEYLGNATAPLISEEVGKRGTSFWVDLVLTIYMRAQTRLTDFMYSHCQLVLRQSPSHSLRGL